MVEDDKPTVILALYAAARVEVVQRLALREQAFVPIKMSSLIKLITSMSSNNKVTQTLRTLRQHQTERL